MTAFANNLDPAAIQPAPISASRGFWRTVAQRLSRDPVSLGCAAVLLTIVLSAVFAPWVAPADPYRSSMLDRLEPIGAEGYLLGTDELGRDMLTRLIYGGRMSLLMGIAPVLAALAIGGALGLIAGYVRGSLNTAIMRITDIFYAFPSVLLAIAISGALGAGLINSLVSLTIVFIPPLLRVTESVTAQVRASDYVDAARASGANGFTVVIHHVLPNVLAPVLVYATGLIGVSIILASGLSFLGLGVVPPEPEWGLMLSTLRQSIYLQPWVSALPGVFIFATSMCFNLLSDGLRSAMDIRA